MKTNVQTAMWSLALATGLLVAMPAANAQEGEGVRKPRQERQERPERREGVRRPDGNFERLKEQLDLSDEQLAKLKPILTAEREEIMAKRRELGREAGREAMREATQAIREKYKAQIDEVLNDEQKAKLKQLRARAPRGPGGPGGPGALRGPRGEGGAGKGKAPEGEGAEPPPPPPSPEM